MRTALALLALAAMIGCTSPKPKLGLGHPSSTSLRRYPIKDPPAIGTAANGRELRLGGFSGLSFEGANEGRLHFITHTDRGPNGSQKKRKDGSLHRDLALPDFQPRLVRLELDADSGEVTLTEQVTLKSKEGSPLNGRASFTDAQAREYGLEGETLTDKDGKALPPSPRGIDPEGIATTGSGEYWMADENIPSLCRFDGKGALQERLTPKGSPGEGSKVLPTIYRMRRANRGFEAIAAVEHKLYGFLQSPLRSKKKSRVLPVVEYDTKARQVSGQLWYELDADTDRIGDATAAEDGSLLVLEYDGSDSKRSAKRVYRVRPGRTRDRGLGSHRVLAKELLVDLGKMEPNLPSKLEGLAYVSEHLLALINDNDFDYENPARNREPTAWLMLVPY